MESTLKSERILSKTGFLITFKICITKFLIFFSDKFQDKALLIKMLPVFAKLRITLIYQYNLSIYGSRSQYVPLVSNKVSI